VKKKKPGEWARGVGYNEQTWDPPVSPTKEDLDAFSPDNPVYITRYCGHQDWVNSKAFELAGITKDTPNPEYGEFVKDAQGNLTGIIVGFPARMMVAGLIPLATPEEQMDAVKIVQDMYLSTGVTSVQCASRIGMNRTDIGVGSLLSIPMMQSLYESGTLKLRVYDMMHFGAMKQLGKPLIGLYGNRYTVRAVKLGADGAIGARGAALFEDYEDQPGWKGRLRIDPATFGQECAEVLKNGFQVRTHAIGDYGIHCTLNAYEEAMKKNPNVTDPRCVVEHAQMIHYNDIIRFRRLGVIASVAPCHLTEEVIQNEEIPRIGIDRLLEVEPLSTLLSYGVHVACNTDSPASPINPFINIQAATTRTGFWKDQKNIPAGGVCLDNGLSRREAIMIYTIGSAYAEFGEKIKGTLEPGKLADMIVIDQDMLDEDKVLAKDIWKTNVLMTFIGGEKVFDLAEKTGGGPEDPLKPQDF
jgi:hypothetical protein